MHHRSIGRFALPLLLATLLYGTGALAIDHPNVERGFAEDKVYAYSGIDSISQMNGNVILTIPIGLTLPVGGGFSYGLTLYYNSKVWDFERHDTDGTGCFPRPTPGCDYTIEALPSRRSTAGLGFRLSLGELIHPTHETNESERWLYVAPDGSERKLHPALRPGQTQHSSCNPLPWNCTFSYTRDGTYLRMEVVSATVREIHFPDGAVHVFWDHAPPGSKPDWKIQSMRDAFGNTVSVIYVNANRWDLSDPHGRLTKVRFTTVAGTRVVSTVEQPAFSGPPSVHTFTYHTGSGGTEVDRGCTDTTFNSLTVNVPLLASVTQPDGSKYEMDYYTDDTAPNPACRQGAIASLTVPTLGEVEWTYQPYNIPTFGCKFREWARFTPGVATRTLKNAAGGVLGTWTYDTAFTLGPPDGSCGFAQPVLVGEELKNTVTNPAGNQVEHTFSIWSKGGASPDGFTVEEYGLPLTRDQSSGGSFRSLRVVEDFIQKRSTFVQYEKDTDACTSVEECTDRNRRQRVTRTVFHDDGDRYTQETGSSWDGQGHYRQRVSSSNFSGSPARTERTEYTGALPATTQPWLLNLFAHRQQTEGGQTAKQEYCFDGQGFLSAMRTLKTGTVRSANDVLVRYQKDNAGNLTEEEHYGGDTGTIATSTACPSPAQFSAAYRMAHTYAAGLRKTSQYRTAAGNLMGFFTLDRTIHTGTGFVSSSRDTSGLQTDFSWDSMGRLSRVDAAPGHDADLEYKYFNATSASQPARVTVTARPQAGGAAVAEEELLYDPFGRLTRRGERMPSGAWSYRTTDYDALGQVIRTSEAHGGTPTFWTQYLDYDAFGRARTVRPPDGSHHDSTYSFLGIRQVQRTVKVGTSRSGSTLVETPQTTTEVYDHQGRLTSVTEPSGGLLATYAYDVGGRLKSAVLKPSASPSPTQTRTFAYDQRGFLLSETHPEKGTVTFHSYDPRGHAGQKLEGPFDLRYTYDRAERLASIDEPFGAGTRQLKGFAYGTANVGANRVRGKLERANRTHYVSLGGLDYEVRARETYTYSGRGGRASSRQTDLFINDSQSDGFTQGWSYDELGSVTTLDYPKRTCIFCVAQPRTQSFTHSRGRLVAVPGYTGTAPAGTPGVGVTYHPSGLVNQVAHANGMVDYFDKDPHGRARPKKSRSLGTPTPRWTSGNYAYDGAGNLVAMGPSEYLYDGVGRLKQADFPTTQLGGGAKLHRSYTYDAFGNLQNIGGTGGRATPTSSTTNRLIGATYDTAGNLTAWNGQAYEYDPFGMVSRITVGSEEWVHAYTADDERLLSFQLLGGDTNRWTLRDLGGNVLREYEYDRSDTSWTVTRDYIHRGSALLAAETTSGTRHFHLDHLGTPRLITDAARTKVAWHTYYPFGEEATSANQDDERRKFTSHERDFHDPNGIGDDVDYMHARYYSPTVGRFLRPDPLVTESAVARPQEWNRFEYALDNPLLFIDPTGLAIRCRKFTTENGERTLLCSDETTTTAKKPKGRSAEGSAQSLGLLLAWLTGVAGETHQAAPSSAAELADTPAMDDIRTKFRSAECTPGTYYGRYDYAHFATTGNVTGHLVGGFGAVMLPRDTGRVQVVAFNEWGLESATRIPGLFGYNNRSNPSVQQMLLNGASLTYPKSLLENRSKWPILQLQNLVPLAGGLTLRKLTTVVLVVATLSTMACQFSEDRSLRRTVRASELTGVWTMSRQTVADLESLGYRPPSSRSDHFMRLHEDGTCIFHTVAVLGLQSRSPSQPSPLSCTWRLGLQSSAGSGNRVTTWGDCPLVPALGARWAATGLGLFGRPRSLALLRVPKRRIGRNSNQSRRLPRRFR